MANDMNSHSKFRINSHKLNKRLGVKRTDKKNISKYPAFIYWLAYFSFLTCLMCQNSSGILEQIIGLFAVTKQSDSPQCPMVRVLAAPEQQWKDVRQVSPSWFLVHWAGVQINRLLLGFCGAAHRIHMCNWQRCEENLPNKIIHTVYQGFANEDSHTWKIG